MAGTLAGLLWFGAFAIALAWCSHAYPIVARGGHSARSAQRKTIVGFTVGSAIVGLLTIPLALIGMNDAATGHPGGNVAVLGLFAGIGALLLSAYLAWGIWWLRRRGRW